MSRRNLFHIAFSLMLIFFLFTPVLLRACNENPGLIVKYSHFAKSTGLQTIFDNQFLFEEKERKENGLEQTWTSPLTICEFSFTVYSSFGSILHYEPTIPKAGNSRPPLFLIKRVLQI